MLIVRAVDNIRAYVSNFNPNSVEPNRNVVIGYGPKEHFDHW